MQTKYAYWVFRNKISGKDRNKIKEVAEKSGYGDAMIKGGHSKDIKDPGVRDTDVSFSNDPFLYDTLTPFLYAANEEAGWKYDLSWFEGVQIARYKKDQYYSWHTDGDSDHFAVYPDNGPDSKNFAGNVRKLSLVAFLSNGYVGGDLELALQRQDEPNEILYPEMECGDVIVFPSYAYHRSTEITEGTKYSLAMWALGPPFK